MGMKNYHRQKELWRSWIAGICLALATVAIVVTAWLWARYDIQDTPIDSRAEQPKQAMESPSIAIRRDANEEVRKPAESNAGVRRAFEDPKPTAIARSAAKEPSPERPRTLAELERDFLTQRDKDAQMDIVAEIAGHNDTAAVQALARLFPQGRNPQVKESLLARLADINEDIAPAARIALLESALTGQPRNVRLTAIDALADSDDPRAIAALRRAAQSDPDRLLREAAAAYAETVEGRQR